MTAKIFEAPMIEKGKTYIQTAYVSRIEQNWYVSNPECSNESTPAFGVSDEGTLIMLLYKMNEERRTLCSRKAHRFGRS